MSTTLRRIKMRHGVKNGMVWGSYGHLRSLEIASFDRVHMSS